MKFPGPVENRRLVTLLEAALHREARLWKVPVYKNGLIQGTDTSSAQHQEVIRWLGEMSRCFRFCPETFALGVCVLHRMLSTVKAQPKYLKCIAFTSLILAAKINEEDEVIGCVKDLVVLSGCSFSTAEILRMERIILDKLHWDLYTATPVDFIHIMCFLAAHLRRLHSATAHRRLKALHWKITGTKSTRDICHFLRGKSTRDICHFLRGKQTTANKTVASISDQSWSFNIVHFSIESSVSFSITCCTSAL